jgi:sugar O-acyltransferase (sialic acid O-acetyltransferase NeuD family)
MIKNNNYTEICLSNIGVNEDSGILQEWLVEEGQFISIGTIICTFETTKSIIEIESDKEGYIVPTLQKNTEVKTRDTIAIVIDNKENIKNSLTSYFDKQNSHRKEFDKEYTITKKAQALIEKHNVDIKSINYKKGIIKTEDILAIIKDSSKASTNYELSIDLKSKPLIIYGAGNGAATLLEAIEINSTYNVVCFVDDIKLHKESLLELPVFHSSELSLLRDKGIKFIACEIMKGKTRLKIREIIENLGFELVNIIHPKTSISKSVIMGIGNYIKSAAVIETNTIIGDCCIIDNGCIIAHDNKIGDGCHIAPGVSFGSSISVGDFTVIGIGSSISTNVTIGKNCIISVGTSVTKNVPDNSIVEGVPGKVIGTVKN